MFSEELIDIIALTEFLGKIKRKWTKIKMNVKEFQDGKYICINLRTPFYLEYDRARNDDKIVEVLKMLELTLYGAVVSQNIAMADKIISFGKRHEYLLGVTNQVCIYVLKTKDQSQFDMWSLLIYGKVVLRLF